jgi:hypothetical protein
MAKLTKELETYAERGHKGAFEDGVPYLAVPCFGHHELPLPHVV